jgi:hypothetical protein
VSWNYSKSPESECFIPAEAEIETFLTWIPGRATPDYDPPLPGTIDYVTKDRFFARSELNFFDQPLKSF